MYILQKGKFKVSASNDATMKNYLKDGWKVVKQPTGSSGNTAQDSQNSQEGEGNGTDNEGEGSATN